MSTWTRCLGAAMAVIALCPPVNGAELHVPSAFATIQTAVDAAIDGDHVIVAPGTYHESVNLLGKKITVRSSGGAAATILDGAQQETSIITAISGESLDAVLQGFTFRNGIGRFTGACELGGFLGGAIFVDDGGISVIDSIFENNGLPRTEEKNFSITGGGAIFACNSDLAVSGSTFRGNMAGHGGAIRFFSYAEQATISNSRFENNRSSHGGAIYSDQRLAASFTLTGSDFDGNEATHGGGVRLVARERATARVSGCTFSNGVSAFGGGVNMTAEERAKIELADSDFFDNEAGFGGGLYTSASGRLPAVIGGRISITSCRFLRNVANDCCDTGVYGDSCFLDGRMPPGNGQFLGGGADIRTVNGGVITVTSSLFAHNSGSPAGGISASSCQGGTIDLVNCTIVENDPGGVKVRLAIPDLPYSTGVPRFRIANSIVRGNAGDTTQIPIEILAGGATADVIFSNVEGGFAGLGNIDVPVTFAGSTPCDYRLAPGSAGIDAGNNDAVVQSITTDLAGKPRFADDPATSDTGAGERPIVDMGAYELQQPSAAAGAGRRRAAGPETGVPCGPRP